MLQSQAWNIQVIFFFFCPDVSFREPSSIFLVQVTKRTSKPLPPKKERIILFTLANTLQPASTKRSLYSLLHGSPFGHRGACIRRLRAWSSCVRSCIRPTRLRPIGWWEPMGYGFGNEKFVDVCRCLLMALAC